MEKLVQTLKEKNLTIGSCESFTAGLFASTMAEVPGASAVLKGGIVTYATQIKLDVVHVSPRIVEQFGVISKECAIEMAKKARTLLDVDICVSFTGNVGPEAMEEKPVGLMYGAIAMDKCTSVFEFYVFGNRNELRKKAVIYMCEQVFQYVNK